ncbi:unnamed protein product [Cuscuta europaea]|nr:unnamed protein product [Cuscuta europaea]
MTGKCWDSPLTPTDELNLDQGRRTNPASFVDTIIFLATIYHGASRSLGTRSGGGTDPDLLRKAEDALVGLPSHVVAVLEDEVAEVFGLTQLQSKEVLSLADLILTKKREIHRVR